MYSALIIFKKTPEVFSYFHARFRLVNEACVTLFSEDSFYYAIFIAPSMEASGITSLKEELNAYILTDKSLLAYGSSREMSNSGEIEYKLRVFPIRNILSVNEFYKSIRPEIAQFFLREHNHYVDYDFICEETNQLFVFTKSEKLKQPVLPNNGMDNARLRFPAFYSRLDKLVIDDIGSPTPLELHFIMDTLNQRESINIRFSLKLFPPLTNTEISIKTESSIQPII